MKNILIIKKYLFLFYCIIIATIYANDKDQKNDFLSFAGIKFEIIENGESN